MRSALKVLCGTVALIWHSSVSPAQEPPYQFYPLRSFGVGQPYGERPAGPVMLSDDGLLYGTLSEGGNGRSGSVWRTRLDGEDFVVLHHFMGKPSDGNKPSGDLLDGKDGFLYGTTELGGLDDEGTVYRVRKNGADYSVLAHFRKTGSGRKPRAGLIAGLDGKLYGVTAHGGAAGRGTVFRINTDGTSLQVILSMQECRSPDTELLQDETGDLYGAADSTRTGYCAVFRLRPDGTAFTLLAETAGPDFGAGGPPIDGGDGALYLATVASTAKGTELIRVWKDGSGYESLVTMNLSLGSILGRLLLASNGMLYGTFSSGTAHPGGGVIGIPKDGGAAIVMEFALSGPGPRSPNRGVIQTSGEDLIGVSVSGGSGNKGSLFRTSLNFDSPVLIRSFDNGNGDGRMALRGSVALADESTLFGVTGAGGEGIGTVYKVSKLGFEIIHRFEVGVDAPVLPATLIIGRDSRLYGTSVGGGANDKGTVFTMATDGTDNRIIWHFGFVTADGEQPSAEMVEGTDGYLYGTTSSGGNIDIAKQHGTIYRLSRDGSEYQVLRRLISATDGRQPYGVIEGRDGRLYGVAPFDGPGGGGTVFAINTDGSGFQVLRAFASSSALGSFPNGKLLLGKNNLFFGTTSTNGIGGFGVIYRLSPGGTDYAVIKAFTTADVHGPGGELFESDDGWLYGTTVNRRVSELASLFRIRNDGTGFATLYSFGTGEAPVLLAFQRSSNGSFFGATRKGGERDYGWIFTVSPNPFVKQPRLMLDRDDLLQLSGSPDTQYRVEASESLGGPWSFAASITTAADAGGVLQTPKGEPTRFYRAVWP